MVLLLVVHVPDELVPAEILQQVYRYDRKIVEQWHHVVFDIHQRQVISILIIVRREWYKSRSILTEPIRSLTRIVLPF